MLKAIFLIGYWIGLLSAKGSFFVRSLIGAAVGMILVLVVYGIARAFGVDPTKR